MELARSPSASVNDNVNWIKLPVGKTVVLTDLNFKEGFDSNLFFLHPESIANKNIENKIVYRIFVV